ncbi:hypothetical protein [Amycolatopsis arida]|nr:hypothetical protein [Amycolatopsis arida]
MAEVISDAQVVAVLRPFVRATGPLLDALREAEPLGLRSTRRRRAGQRDAESGGVQDGDGAAELAAVPRARRWWLVRRLRAVRVPGTQAWTRMTPDQRTRWWVNRVGRFTSLLTAVPGLGGVLADRLPIQDAVGAASQGLLLCAIAGEYGVVDTGDRVRLLAWVLFQRDVDPALAAGRAAEHDRAAEDAETAQLTEEVAEAERRHGKLTLKAAARTLWRLGRSLLAFPGELEKRPRGRFYHRLFGMLPVVGMLADYLGERSALKRLARRACRWLERRGALSGPAS